MMTTDSTTQPAPAVYRHTSQWGHDTRVTAELPEGDAAYTHWWVTFHGVRWPGGEYACQRPATLSPCYEDGEKLVLRIPYVTGGTRVFADVLHDVILGQFLCGLDSGDETTMAHISLSAPLPDCSDDDDDFLQKKWAIYSGDPRRAWLWDAPTTTTDDSTPAGAPAAAPALWCDGLAEDEIRTLRDELTAELARRGNGSQGAPVAAWMGELTTAELTDMFADLKNEIVKLGLKTGDKEPGI